MSEEITFDDIEFGEPIEEREPTYREGYIRGIYRAKNIIDSKQKEIERLNNIINELSKENQELKKQLENKYEKVGTLTSELLYEENTKLINQQKEFIEYLEDEIKLREEINDIVLATGFEEILQNYKEIIGDVKNEKENIKEISKRFKFKEILDKAVNDMQGTNLYYSKEFVDDIISKLKEKDKEIERLNNIINKGIEAINVYQNEKTLSIGYQDLKRIRGILRGNEFDLKIFEEYLQELKGVDKE